MANSDIFLSSFNRIEKWMRDAMGNARNMGSLSWYEDWRREKMR